MADKKQRKTVSLDRHTYENLQDVANASSTVNELLRAYFDAGRSKEAALQKKIADKEEELAAKRRQKSEIETSINRLEREIEYLQDRIHALNDEEIKQVETVVGLIEEGAFDQRDLVPDNELVQQRSTKAGMHPERFIQEVNERL